MAAIKTPCSSDRASRYICNDHAEIFQLNYLCRTTTNGDNNQRSEIFTVITSQTRFNLPLFVRGPNKIDADELTTFVTMVTTRHKNIQPDLLYSAISSLLHSSPRMYMHYTESWLDREDNMLYGHSDTNQCFRVCTKDLPLLHKMLFCYSKPSLTMLDETTADFEPVTTICLKSEKSQRTPYFTTPNPKNVLKYINKDSIIGNFVICGERTIPKKHNVTEITQENYDMGNYCD
ncbi:VP39 [Phenacoccus solenopsis nudivirus]|nr:VP39 [Phenacoccus solenopsis nudivirus]